MTGDALRSATVYVVEDEEVVREVVRTMLARKGLHVEAYPSAESFLDAFTDDPGRTRALVLDVRMPGMSGLALQTHLLEAGIEIPIVFLTGQTDTQGIVEAMKAGAVDYLEKPVRTEDLLHRVAAALDRDARRVYRFTKQQRIDRRMASLSDRERDVYELLVDGLTTKQIASKLDIGQQTVAKHRAAVLSKMGVKNVVELVRLVAGGE